MDEIYKKLDTLQASTSLLGDTYNSDVQIAENGYALFGKEVRTPIINGLGSLTTKVNDTAIAVASSSQIDFQGIDLVNINNLQTTSTTTGTHAAGVNIATGQTYKVNAVDVLSATTLGSSVVSSSLTSIGKLTGLAVGSDNANASALVTMSSTSKGLLIPRMTTTQKNAIAGTPTPTGLLVYDTTLLALNHYNGSAWSSISGAASNPVVVAINNTNSPYTLTTATDILICTASAGSITIVLPTAIGNSGKILRFIRTDTTLSYNVSLTTVSGQTIGGLTIRRMWTANESWNIVSDGEDWQILSHNATTKWTSPEAITITGTTSNPSKGTGGTDKILWRRDGDIAEINMRYSPGTGSTDGSGDYVYRIPTGLTMDTSIIQTYTTVEGPGIYALGHAVIGYGAIVGGSSDVGVLCCIAYSSTQYRLASFTTGTTPDGYISSGYFGNTVSGTQINATLRVPITNWDA